jgi:hypothetical protein
MSSATPKHVNANVTPSDIYTLGICACWSVTPRRWDVCCWATLCPCFVFGYIYKQSFRSTHIQRSPSTTSCPCALNAPCCAYLLCAALDRECAGGCGQAVLSAGCRTEYLLPWARSNGQSTERHGCNDWPIEFLYGFLCHWLCSPCILSQEVLMVEAYQPATSEQQPLVPSPPVMTRSRQSLKVGNQPI